MSFPSVLTSRKIATQQSSSAGYDSGTNSEDENDVEKVTSITTNIVDKSFSKQRRKRKRRKEDTFTSFTSNFKQQNKAVVLFLLRDLYFVCWIVSILHDTYLPCTEQSKERVTHRQLKMATHTREQIQ
jgi:hypothetical protein